VRRTAYEMNPAPKDGSRPRVKVKGRWSLGKEPEREKNRNGGAYDRCRLKGDKWLDLASLNSQESGTKIVA